MKHEHNQNEDMDHGGLSPEEIDAASEPVNGEMLNWDVLTSVDQEMNRESMMFDIDRMVNEGLGGGNVTADSGWVGETTTDTMETVEETPRNLLKDEEND